MKVLLIWQAVGDSDSFYVIDDASEEDVAALEAAHGKIVGSTEDDSAAAKISDMLSPEDDWCMEPGADYNCKWKDLKVKEKDLPKAGPFDRAYVSGFFA